VDAFVFGKRIEESHPMRFDLLLKGGHVIDQPSGYDGVLDLAVKRNRVAAVDADIPPESAAQVLDLSGQYVVPGLVDLHSHVYRGATAFGIDAENLGSRTGVTTWVDAGSAGAYNVEGLREFVADRSRVRIYSLLNISGVGLTAPDYELARLEWCNTKLFVAAVKHFGDFVVGTKVRMGVPQFPVLGLEPLMRARAVSDEVAHPLMVHIAWQPPRLEEVLPYLKARDILTHCFTGLTMRIVDERGRLRDDMKRMHDAGVILDIGHGSGSFSFKTAEALMGAGVLPDVISTDAHQHSVQGPMFDLPTCMSKLLHLGMPLPKVFAAATANPARVIGLYPEIGSLKPGSLADVAAFVLDAGEFALFDFSMDRRTVKQLLRNTLTVVNGRVLAPQAPALPAFWLGLTEAQRTFVELRKASPQERFAAHLFAPEHFDAPTPVERDATPLPREQ
jgi:dihydroorotase